MLIRLKMSTAELGRFIDRVVKREDGCWEWTGYKEKGGYGEFNFAGKKMRAHRISYRHYVGEIPDNKPFLDHTCENKACVNPQHLEPVTSAENTRRWAAKKFQGKCLRGHKKEMGKECGYCIALRTGRTWLKKFENVCYRGHKFTPENTYWVGPQKKTRLCKTCNRAKQRYLWSVKKLLALQIAVLRLYQTFPVPLPTKDFFLVQSEQ